MKIAVFDTIHHPTPILKEWGIGFTDLGHDVDFYAIQHHTILSCLNIPYDLIVYVGDMNVHHFEQVKLNNLNVKIVCAADSLQSHFVQFKGLVDFFITTQHSCKTLTDSFNDIGIKLYNVPLAGNDHLFYPLELEKELDVCFIGTLGHGYRGEDKYLYPLLDNPNYNCFLAGMTYKQYNVPFLEYEKANTIRNLTKVNINFHVAYQHENHGYPADRIDLNQSVYNIALSGGFQICDHQLANLLFENSIVLGTEENWNELVDYYIHNDLERNELAYQSRTIALEKHTWKVRMREFLQILENHEYNSISN
jgi:spore maturation protein CgeB